MAARDPLGIRALVVGAAVLFLASHAAAENWARELRGGSGDVGSVMNINVIGGVRVLDDSDWDPIDQQTEVGLDFDYTGEEWPWGVGMCATAYYSWADESVDGGDLKSTTMELQLGVRKTWHSLGMVRPYLGGGGSVLNVDLDFDAPGESGSKDDTAFGFWLGGGMYVTFFDALNVGVDARWSKVDIEIESKDADAGGWHVGGFIGYHWQEW